MKIGVITGTVVSTVKYERYRGMKMLKARNLTLEGEPVGEEFDDGLRRRGSLHLAGKDGLLPLRRREAAE